MGGGVGSDVNAASGEETVSTLLVRFTGSDSDRKLVS